MDAPGTNSAARAADAPYVKADPWRIFNRPEASDMFGLCALRSNIYAERDIEDAVLDVEISGQRKRLPASEISQPVGERIWRILFHINSHLLENGLQTLALHLIWPDGTRTPLGETTFNVRNTNELARGVRRDLQASNAPSVFGQVVDSALFPYASGTTRAWFDQPPIEDVPLSFEPALDADAARRHLSRWGFALLPETVPQELVQAFNREADEAIAQGTLSYRVGSSDRILNAHHLPGGRKIWLYPPVLSFLKDWFRDDPCACQTLLYINGSEQNPHQDTIHLTPYPAGYMCGVWVALEDVRKDSGELVVYPGSHRAPRLYASELGLEKVSDDYSSYAKFDAEISRSIEREGFERRTYMPLAGQILVWHENLIHGGGRRVDPNLTRRSIVSHYFPRGGIAYYDSRGEAATLEALG